MIENGLKLSKIVQTRKKIVQNLSKNSLKFYKLRIAREILKLVIKNLLSISHEHIASSIADIG